MPSRSWYRWFYADYMNDTAHLTIEQDCLYRRLLDIHFRDGSLPADPQRIRILARFPEEVFEGAWEEVRHYFKKRGDRFFQSRMASELRGVKRKIAQSKSAANARWNKRLDANAMRSECQGDAVRSQSDPDPDPDPERREKKEDLSQEPVSGGRVRAPRAHAREGDAAAPEKPPPKTAATQMWELAQRLLGSRSLVGKLVREHGEGRVMALVGEIAAMRNPPADVRAYLTAALQERKRHGDEHTRPRTKDDYAQRQRERLDEGAAGEVLEGDGGALWPAVVRGARGEP